MVKDNLKDMITAEGGMDVTVTFELNIVVERLKET